MYPASRSTAFPSSSSRSLSYARLWSVYQRLSLRLLYFSARCWLGFLISLALLLLIVNLAFAYLPSSPLPAGIGLLQKLAVPFNRGAARSNSAPQGPINAAPPVASRSSGAADAASPSAASPSQMLPLARNASSSPLWTAPASSYCDRQFGNGFSVSVQLCAASPSTSTLRCLHNPLTASTLCEATNIALDGSRLDVSRGDEEIEAVRGRAEEAELPKYRAGALTLDCRQPSPPPSLSRPVFPHHLSPMLSSVSYAALPAACEQLDSALLITRYEYANLYHTLTDLYNAYQAMRLLPAASASQPAVVFLDGHSKGAMDGAWPALFSADVRYIKHSAQPLCIRHAAIVSPGYGSALSPDMFRPAGESCVGHPLLLDFASFVRRRFRLGEEEGGERVIVKDVLGQEVSIGDDGDDEGGRRPLVSFIVRRPYLAHPRVKPGGMERTIADEAATVRSIAQQLEERGGIAFHAFDLSELPLHTQLNLLHHSQVIVGLHGAALSHVVFMPQQSALLELLPAGYDSRQHFAFLARWSGHRYRQLRAQAAQAGFIVDATAVANAVLQLVEGDRNRSRNR